MNKKGQALIEFIIILPIFIMIILAAFDLVNIFSTKMKLESLIEEVVLKESYALDDNIKLTTSKTDDFITYKLTKKVEMISPFVTVITDDLYKVTVERVIYD